MPNLRITNFKQIKGNAISNGICKYLEAEPAQTNIKGPKCLGAHRAGNASRGKAGLCRLWDLGWVLWRQRWSVGWWGRGATGSRTCMLSAGGMKSKSPPAQSG